MVSLVFLLLLWLHCPLLWNCTKYNGLSLAWYVLLLAFSALTSLFWSNSLPSFLSCVCVYVYTCTYEHICMCMCLCVPHAYRSPQMSKEAVGYSEDKVTSFCELPSGCWKLKPALLKEQ